jgi:hypothetical protein
MPSALVYIATRYMRDIVNLTGLILLLFCFIACEDDDNGNGNGNGSNAQACTLKAELFISGNDSTVIHAFEFDTQVRIKWW